MQSDAASSLCVARAVRNPNDVTFLYAGLITRCTADFSVSFFKAAFFVIISGLGLCVNESDCY